MGFEQDTLIYIEDQEKLDASAAANAFAHKDIKNRAYINTLGAELALKYLTSEGIDIPKIYNIHSIKKILEEMDISDVMLPNIHIDVRVVFDENVIFIPKSHFEYNLVPDIYLVFNLSQDFSYVKFLGFFEPKLINKNNANKDYYFIEKEKLTPVHNLKQFIENFNGNTKEELSEDELSSSERIIIAMADNDISDDEKKYLIKQLTKSAQLRDKFIEYENFETLSYKAMADIEIKKPENKINSDIQEITSLNITENIEENKLSDETALNNENNDNTLLDTLTDTSVAMTAEETMNNTLNNSLDITDKGIELAKDLISDDVTPLEPLAFDDIDTSEIDNIQPSNETFEEEEKISLNDVQLPDIKENTDYINEIDNKISFEDISEETPLQTETTFNIDEETISLNDIDTANISELNNTGNFEESFVSLDDIDTTGITVPSIENENNQTDEQFSFENIDSDALLNNSINDMENENYTLDDITTNIKMNDDVNIEENSGNFENDITLNDEFSSFEQNDNQLEQPEIIDSEEENGFSSSQDTDFIDNEVLTDNLPADLQEEQEKTEGFGKNLLDNLSSENLDDISIENLDIDAVSIPESTDEISSDDLLSQADALLDSVTEEAAETNEENSLEAEASDISFEDIPEIDDITPTPIEEDIEQNDDNSVNEIEQKEQDITENINNIEQHDEITDISIDDLLNMDNGDVSTESSILEKEEEDLPQDEDKLGVLFNDTDPVTDAELDNMEEFNDGIIEEEEETQPVPGSALFNKPEPAGSNNKKVLVVAAAVVTLAVAASAFIFLKPKNGNDDVNNTQSASTSEVVNPPEQQDTTENILANNAPDINKTKPVQVQKNEPAKELKNVANAKKPVSSESYLTVNRIVWDVPDSLLYSNKMQDYLRSAGKSIKLRLSADLLLATEYAYTNQVKVNLKLSKEGSVQDANISSSSGSAEIDKIVLQSVKDTLNDVKPPSDVIKSPDFNLNLIIYF